MIHVLIISHILSSSITPQSGSNFSHRLVLSLKDIDYDTDAGLEDSDEDEYEGNKDAARALLRVKQKLDGYEDGEMRSARGQVLVQLSIHFP